jgi:GntR family transcriptional regulator, transcriptional repressor for pyruvate dehydrogenase complex
MFVPVGQKSVVDEILEQVRSLILDGQLGPNSCLPPETTLAKSLRVSRQSVREALRNLIGEGLIEVRQGDGIYVRAPTSADVIRRGVLQLLLASGELWEIQEIRKIIEPSIAAKAAERGTDEDFEKIEEILVQMERKATRNESVFGLAWEFHLGVADAARNSAMTKIVDVIYQMIRAAEGPLYNSYFDPWEEITGHRELLAIIRKRDPALAREGMKKHLESVDQRLSESLKAKTKTEPIMTSDTQGAASEASS